MKQVLGLATMRPFLGPLEHLKPCLGALPLVRLRIWLTPSAMAEWSGCSSIVPCQFSDTISCGTRSCVWSPLMALDVVALDPVFFSLVGTRVISVIFIRVFIGLTPNASKPNCAYTDACTDAYTNELITFRYRCYILHKINLTRTDVLN